MKKIIRFAIPFFAAFLMLGMMFYLAAASNRAAAAPSSFMPYWVIVVTTLEDELNSDSDCSLREAIEAANDNTIVDACVAGDAVITDTITFAVSGMVSVTSQLSVTAGGPLLIVGGDAITISGGNSVRVLYVGNGALVALENITVADGFSENIRGGGGIQNEGTLTIHASNLTGNHDDSMWGGGAISNWGALDIIASTFFSNSADYDGGAINIFDTSSGTVTIANSIFSGNHASSGGAIMNNANMNIANSTFSGNNATYGGAIFAYWNSMLTITASTFSANGATTYGGGIHNNSTLSVINSNFSDNNADEGGGLYNSIWDYGASRIMQSTVTITNSTFSGNSAVTGGGLYVDFGTVTPYNTILADSPSGGDCYGTIIDGGHNLDSDDTCGLDPANGSLPNTDPLLGPLQDNGGSTWTHALQLGSPAIDAGDNAYCPTTDQRGVIRPIDGNGDGIVVCDIGSFELEEPLYPLFLPLVVKNS